MNTSTNSVHAENAFWLKQLTTSTALLDDKFHLVDASPSWKSKFLFHDFEVVGKSIFEIFPNFSKDWKTKLDFAKEGLKDIQIIDEVDLKDGSSKKVVWHLNSWKNSKGAVVGVVLNVEDVTRIKELEFELLSTKNLLAEKGEIAKIGSWEYDVEKQVFELSSATKRIFKLKKTSKISIIDIIRSCGDKSTAKNLKAIVQEAIEKGKPWNKTLSMLSVNDDAITVNTIGRPKFKNGKCRRIIGTAQIVNDKTKVKTESNGGNQNFFLENAPVAMALVDFSSGRILKVNRELLELSGFEESELVGKKYLAFISSSVRKDFSAKAMNEKNNCLKTSLDFTDNTGNKKIVSIKGKLTNNGEGLLCVLEDITNSVKATTGLKNKVKRGEEHIDKLVNFTHMISHNLKGHAINYALMLDFLEEVEDEKERKNILEILKESTDHLSETIYDLREMVSIGKGVKAKRERVSINDFIFKAEQNLSGELQKSRAKIINEIPDTLKIKGYPIYLENIMTNFISNAVKFKKPNKIPLISIATEITKEHTIILIEDNGIGMNLKKKGSKLFRMGSSLGNDHESRGMGLYLAKYQIELMKGKIEVESKVNEGSVFKLFFPHN